MKNLIVHITLPKGIKTKTGALLAKDVTFDVISRLDPYYASVDQVRLAGGMMLRKLSDLTIAASIYNTSQKADLLQLHAPEVTDVDNFKRFVGARNNWVAISTAHELVLNINQLLGQKGSHVLANFSVAREGPSPMEGIGARLKDMVEDIKQFEVTIRSRGRTVPGGRPSFGMAAKGVNDFTERSPGRTWMGNGFGANARTGESVNGVGGRGKTMTMSIGPFYSPPFFNLRYGMHVGGGAPLSVAMTPHPGIL